MQKYTLLKLFGLVILAQIILVAISFAEVWVYSIFVNPGQGMSEYEKHANLSAPWVSGIFGFILFFFVARYWTRKKLTNAFRLALLFPLTYVVWDMVVVVIIGVPDWLDFLPVFLLANGAKVLGSLAGYYFYRDK